MKFEKIIIIIIIIYKPTQEIHDKQVPKYDFYK